LVKSLLIVSLDSVLVYIKHKKPAKFLQLL
jgi:hypothetical protein